MVRPRVEVTIRDLRIQAQSILVPKSLCYYGSVPELKRFLSTPEARAELEALFRQRADAHNRRNGEKGSDGQVE